MPRRNHSRQQERRHQQKRINKIRRLEREERNLVEDKDWNF